MQEIKENSHIQINKTTKFKRQFINKYFNKFLALDSCFFLLASTYVESFLNITGGNVNNVLSFNFEFRFFF